VNPAVRSGKPCIKGTDHTDQATVPFGLIHRCSLFDRVSKVAHSGESYLGKMSNPALVQARIQADPGLALKLRIVLSLVPQHRLAERFAAEQRNAFDAMFIAESTHGISNGGDGHLLATSEWQHFRVATTRAAQRTALKPQREPPSRPFGLGARNAMCDVDKCSHENSIAQRLFEPVTM
jgi:hypothetical protein